jgi:hypothetical protein
VDGTEVVNEAMTYQGTVVIVIIIIIIIGCTALGGPWPPLEVW